MGLVVVAGGEQFEHLALAGRQVGEGVGRACGMCGSIRITLLPGPVPTALIGGIALAWLARAR